PKLLLPTNLNSYLSLYGIFLLPNILFISILVFGVVLWTRNIFTGFIISLLLILVPQLTGAFFGSEQQLFWAALFDPFGRKAISFYTENWTIAEQNLAALPIKGLVIYNRLLWLGITALVGTWIYRQFQFQQAAVVLSTYRRFIHFWKIKRGFNPSPTLPLQGKGATKSRTFWQKTITIIQPADNRSPSILKGGARGGLKKITKVQLPKITLQFNWQQQLKTLWYLSMTDFRFMVRSKAFLILVMGGLAFVLLIMATVRPRWGTETLPMTWQILELESTFRAGVINLITFLYAGILIQRSKMNQVQPLEDSTPTPNWVFLGSILLALVKVQIVLLSMVMVGGITSQISKGFYQFEIGQYLFNLFGINLIHFVIWALLAIFVQTLINHPYVGFFLLLLLPAGFIGLAEFGPQFLGMDILEQDQFRYNQAPGGVFGLRYSDMDGYGPILTSYFIYKFYWLLAGLVLLFAALLFQVRGLPKSFRERLQIARQRFNGRLAMGFLTMLVAFGSLSAYLYYENNIEHSFVSRKERQELVHEAEEKYKRYEFFHQPKITSVKVNMDIFPKERQFKASGNYTIVNKHDKPIDTLIVNYLAGLNTTYELNKAFQVISEEKIADVGHFDLLKLEQPLTSGDSLVMCFQNYSAPITALHIHEWVKSNGTLIKDDIFPRLGNWIFYMKSGGHNHDRPHPADSITVTHSFSARDADQVNFEAIVSTSEDQVAIAPGMLQKEWTENNRNYFHYKMSEKMSLLYLFVSGDYAVKKGQWQDIDLAVYYDKKHPYNIDRMMAGMKASLAYCSENYSPYQFQQVRLVEFSQTGGASAHGYPSMIPTGEGAGFIADLRAGQDNGFDIAYGTAVHEVAHQWWGHQVMPADALGSKMVIESMADYTTAKVVEKEKGVAAYRNLLKKHTAKYLELRNRERQTENPLSLATPNQNYIHYSKGTVVLCALSDYLGDEVLNGAIKEYVQKVAFQENEYTTSLELVDFIRKATPDSLQYLIKDLLETVTLYENKMLDWTSTKLDNGQYQVKLNFLVSKHRGGKNGARVYEEVDQPLIFQGQSMDEPLQSLPLADYLEIGIFGDNEKELYLKKHQITQIDNELSIIVDELPMFVGIDPYGKMIDKDALDNILKKGRQ
ncbi:MAG: M1 family aminopeptidase, partial [Bacteroidota bacterium]